MSCNGCRVLRKGCSENCILRPCLQWIETPEAQGHATIFVAKFFGRADLMSFISAVPENQRPGLFQSLLYEAAGRTVNPVNGVVGLLWTGNWHVCQVAVETVLRGGTLSPIPELFGKSSELDEESECTNVFKLLNHTRSKMQKRRRSSDEAAAKVLQLENLDLSLLTRGFQSEIVYSPSRNSEESVTTTCFESSLGDHQGKQPRLLSLFT
ncbi:LOB domain-containing protein 38 [Nicotiana tabacum]|uniref:LOB domain-containing protein 38 n=2 Tax=Nicotiana TaxID=4085 RepID=A0A1S3X0X3_TOBAC|nr:PREDICTED: LOB domain-containing protein 38-like [Nicotiana sylvestris]XP_016433338.1 PREDICTED: LOB domain-containing protein 38-like [Nicotiana tabacum]